MPTTKPDWIALAATEELPILRAPVEAAAGRIPVRNVALPYKPLSASEEVRYARFLQGAAGILLRSGFMTASLLERLPDLKVIAVHGAGIDPVDIDACTRRGVIVSNTPGANAAAVAELTLGLILASVRRIPQSAGKVRTERAWDGARFTGIELQGRILGLVGLGQIGRRVAAIAAAFGMTVLAYDPAVAAAEAHTHGTESVNLSELLARADVVSLHAPALPETFHLIDEAAIASMKRSAVLVNCARGSLVDEVALAQALTAGRLGGAALDVLEGEPPDPDSPIFAAPNVIVTPHMAGSTHECLETIARTAGTDIVRVLRGEAPLHPVNAPSPGPRLSQPDI